MRRNLAGFAILAALGSNAPGHSRHLAEQASLCSIGQSSASATAATPLTYTPGLGAFEPRSNATAIAIGGRVGHALAGRVRKDCA
jgi:hypothetical protein